MTAPQLAPAPLASEQVWQEPCPGDGTWRCERGTARGGAAWKSCRRCRVRGPSGKWTTGTGLRWPELSIPCDGENDEQLPVA